jgi:hypothetical protein
VTEVSCSRSWSSDLLTYDCTGKGRECKRNLKTDRLLWESYTYAISAFSCTFYPINAQSHSGPKVGATLVFLSVRYNESLPVSSLQQYINSVLTPIQWSNPAVITSITLACVFAILFLLVEFFIAPEPVLAPSLLKQKIPLLVGASNFLVSMCNFSIIYFFPMWFQTVILTSASIAGMRRFSHCVIL